MSTMMTRITQLEAKVAYQAKEMAEKVGILLQAAVLFNEVSKHQPVSLTLLLYGKSSLMHETNVFIF